MGEPRSEGYRAATLSNRRADAGERAWVFASGLVVVAAAVARVHNAFAFPALHDFDGVGHALNVFSLYQGQLPDPAAWSGFHPPLFHAAGAALWSVLPQSVPVHTGLRLLSAAAGFAALAVTWRALRRFVGPADAAITAALVAGAPVFAIATSMLGNETSCALFTSLALARLASAPAPDDACFGRHSIATIAVASLAALAKSTGLVAVAWAALIVAWRGRRARARTARVLLVAALPVAILLGPHYGRLAVRSGSLLAPVSGYAHSAPMRAAMAGQPPGVRRVADYLRVPSSTLLAPSHDSPGMLRSVPGLLYASTWADGHGRLLPSEVPAVASATALLAIGGLVPTALALAGVLRAWRERSRLAGAGSLFGFAGLLGAGFLVQTWVLPFYSAVKASYLLPALLPFSLLLALGLAAARGRVRVCARAALLAYAACAVGATWWGWWREASTPASVESPSALAPAGTPEAAVDVYLRSLGRDPLRTLPLLTDAAHRQHGLGLTASGAGNDVRRVSMDERRLAWLAAQTGGPVLALAGRLRSEPVAVALEGDRAEVAMRISAPPAPAFEQRFYLQRADAAAPWTIDQVLQTGVVAANDKVATAAWPSQAPRSSPARPGASRDGAR